MAVSGSGGWIPSALFVYRKGQLRQIGLAHNTPRMLVCDPESAVVRLRRGEPVRMDVRGGVSLKRSKTLLSTEPIRIPDRPVCS